MVVLVRLQYKSVWSEKVSKALRYCTCNLLAYLHGREYPFSTSSTWTKTRNFQWWSILAFKLELIVSTCNLCHLFTIHQCMRLVNWVLSRDVQLINFMIEGEERLLTKYLSVSSRHNHNIGKWLKLDPLGTSLGKSNSISRQSILCCCWSSLAMKMCRHLGSKRH